MLKSNITRNSSPPVSKLRILPRLFWEYFKISTIVVGGGYAIILTADEVFGKRLKWIETDELLRKLPVFQSVPGLIATNSAVYVGIRVAGIAGGIAAVIGAALPSFLVINFIAMGYDKIPLDNRFLQGAFLGLRASMCGIIIAAIIKSWKNVMRGTYAWICMPTAIISLLLFKIPPATVLIIAIACGLSSALLPMKPSSDVM